jgi:hypothetical protein
VFAREYRTPGQVALEALASDAPLPWRLDERHPGQILDAENGAVAVVDVDSLRTDRDAERIARLIVEAVNAAARDREAAP